MERARAPPDAGTHRLAKESARLGAHTQRHRGWTDAERQTWRELTNVLTLARYLCPRYGDDAWTEAEIKMLGTMSGDEVAAKTARTPAAARIKRRRVRLKNATEKRRKK